MRRASSSTWVSASNTCQAMLISARCRGSAGPSRSRPRRGRCAARRRGRADPTGSSPRRGCGAGGAWTGEPRLLRGKRPDDLEHLSEDFRCRRRCGRNRRSPSRREIPTRPPAPARAGRLPPCRRGSPVHAPPAPHPRRGLDPVGSARHGAELRIGLAADVTSMDRTSSASRRTSTWLARVRRAHPRGRGRAPHSCLAVSWRALDATTWEFRLRRGVRFHDGPSSPRRTWCSRSSAPSRFQRPVPDLHAAHRRQRGTGRAHAPAEDRDALRNGALRSQFGVIVSRRPRPAQGRRISTRARR